MGSIEAVRQLTTNDLEFIHSESAVGDYFTIDADGNGLQLHDVVTRKPLVPYAVPDAIMQNTDLAAGIDWLRRTEAGRLTVQLVLGPHSSAENFKQIVQCNQGPLSNPWVAFEMSWRSRYMSNTALPNRVGLELADHKFVGRRAFQTEELLWANRHDKKVMPAEMPVDSESILLTELDHLWYDINEPLRESSDITPVIRDAAALIGERAYQATRQWTIVAQLGNWMMRLDRAGKLPEDHVTLPLVIGTWHARSADRFRSLGVEAESNYTENDPALRTEAMRLYGDAMMDSMYDGHIGIDLLRTASPF